MTYTINDEQRGGSRPPLDQPCEPPRMTIGGRAVPEFGPMDTPPPTLASGDTPIQVAYNTLQRTNRALADHLDAVNRQRDMLSPDGQKAMIAAFADSPDARAVDLVEQLATDRKAQAQARYDQERAALSREGDAAEEMRAGRFWDREKAMLDRQDSGTLAAKARHELIKASATPAELSVLVDELVPYLESRGAPTEWVEPILAQVVPALASAKAELTVAQQGKTVISQAASFVRNGIEKGCPAAALDQLDPRKIRSRNVDPDA
jgi:hypothetical protein